MKNLSSEVTRLQDLVSQKNEATINIEMMRRQLPMAEVSEEDNASQKEPVNVRNSLFSFPIDNKKQKVHVKDKINVDDKSI